MLLLLALWVAGALAQNCKQSYQVTMRDGVNLTTVVHFPAPCTGKYPSVIDRTPYGPGSDTATNYLQYGFVAVQQDQRGCWTSGGTYDFWKNDSIDAYDTMAWITNQTWSNGLVYQVGVSADACSLYTDFIVENPYIKGAYATWGSGFGHETSYWGGAYVQGLIKRWLDELVMCRGSIEIEKEVEQHEAYDSWWEELEANGPYGDHFPSDDVPAVHRAVWWDIFQQQMLNTFNGAWTDANPDVRQQQYLFVEPLGHCESSAKDFKYPNYVINDWFTMSLAIFQNDWTNPVFSRTSTINIYVLGPVPSYVPFGTTIVGNYWSSFPEWPVTTMTNYYLTAQGGLSTTIPAAGSKSFLYNPKNPVPTTGGNNLLVQPCGPEDQRPIESRSDVLNFSLSTTFTQSTAICGHFTATLFVSSNQVDTDFYVSITDVYPDGQSILLRYGALRMRWRDDPSTLTLMTPGQIYNVTVDLWSNAYIFNAGHSMRVLITSSNYPQFDVNPNNGNPIANLDQPFFIANNTVYTGGSYASYVTIPFVNINSLPKNTQIQ
jgi:hypothetical protein